MILLADFDFPQFNAGLNTLCTVLLIVGYLSIRGKRVRLHMTCMLSALVVSAVFLTSYLYYHFAIKAGKMTLFPDTPLRPVYYAILTSHIVLAIVVAPVAPWIAWLGYRNRLGSHVRLARWTLPIWLYVTVTGVVVYWMLYRLYPPT